MVESARIRRLLPICGLLASLVWVGNDIVAGTLWQGYSFTDQAVSELSAIGAPTRSLVVSVLLVYDVLMIAFGLGVWAHTRQRSLRLIGSLAVVIGALGFAGVPFPLQLGLTEATFTNTMHSIIAGAIGFLFLVAMGFGAFANGKRFRLFSVGTLLTLIVIGGVSAFMAGADISQHGFTAPPQWFGLIERIDIYGSMLWVAVLAIVLLRARAQDSDVKPEESGGAVSFREITRRSTWPIELLNNVEPKHRIYGLVEIDVTKARKFISENEAKTGEKLSFTAWVIKCIAQAVSEQREVQAFKKGKKKLIVFDDVDVGLIVERQVKSERVPIPYAVRKANEKSFRQIHDEIRRAQKNDASGRGAFGEELPASTRVFLRLPGLMRKPFWWKIRSDPFLKKRFLGTVGVTAVGMFGKGGGWAIPIGLHPVVFALGGISRKPRDLANPVDVGEYLSMTVMFDEEVSLGAPATRFIARLSELMQTGFGLE